MKDNFTVTPEKELSSEDSALVKKASEIRANAYAPYSAFNVGAAIVLDNGEIVCGTNQENAAYPSGLCAERVAIFYASTIYPSRKILSVAVVGGKEHEVEASPCGSCRQVLLEYEMKQKSPIRVLFRGKGTDIVISNSVSALLPFPFSLD